MTYSQGSSSSKHHPKATTASESVPMVLPPDFQAHIIPSDAPLLPPIPLHSADDYPNVKYWSSADWVKLKKHQSKHYYIQLEDGSPASTKLTKAMSTDAREIFKSVWATRILSNGSIIPPQRPDVWTDVPEEVVIYYCHKMVHLYPALALCQGGQWKARKFATTVYSSSMRTFRGRKRRRNSDGDECNGDEDDDDDARPPKRQQSSQKVPYCFRLYQIADIFYTGAFSYRAANSVQGRSH